MAFQGRDDFHVAYITRLLHGIEAAVDTDTRVILAGNLFEYLLAHCSFLYHHTKLCNSVKSKLAQLRQMPEAARILGTIEKLNAVVIAIQGLRA